MTTTIEHFSLDAFEAARERISGHVRRTPLIRAAPSRHDPAPRAQLLLKLENLQATGSFKVRGATNMVQSLTAPDQNRGLVTASSGNHGLGVAYAAKLTGTSATVYVPVSSSTEKVRKLEAWNATVHSVGQVWDEANEAALEQARSDGQTYVHPFASPPVILGQGTLALEILDQAPGIDTILVAVGGGGLIAGVAAAAKAIRPDLRVIGVEPIGAPTHYRSRKERRLVTLDRVETRAGSLAPRRSDPVNLALVEAFVDDLVLVSDGDMERAARWLWTEFAIASELGGAAVIAALQSGAVDAVAGSTVCAIICGAGTDGLP